MSKIQISSGRSSSATHRLTQASTTLNRRYVRRPSNIVVEEAARNAAHETNEPETPTVPSRLVNLRVSAADLEAARAKEEKALKMAQEEKQTSTVETKPVTFTPNIIEFGANEPEASKTVEVNMDIQKPKEEPGIEQKEVQQLTSIIEPETTDDQKPKEEIDTKDLVMNIAADYAAASLGASIKEYGNGYDNYAIENSSVENAATEESTTNENPTTDSVDAIARAASEAIASIRVATEPAEVSEQVSSLKAFADNIKSDQSMPEMRELGDTIDKFINIAMKSTKMQEASKKSTTPKVALSPKASRAATKVTKTSAKVMQANNRAKRTAARLGASNTVHAVNRNVAKAPAVRPNRVPRTTTHTISREDALQAAMRSVATMEDNSKKSAPKPMLKKRKGMTKRFAIAIACAAVCVLGVIGIVGSNIPDISIRVAAMQTGIEASYPSYIPRDYSLSDINSENGKITMLFNGPEGATFTLVEEKSSWDSSALLRNYVEPTWQENYATTHEQGITIYIDNINSDATWVNGGILYKITSSGTPLTKKQVRSIVTSL